MKKEVNSIGKEVCPADAAKNGNDSDEAICDTRSDDEYWEEMLCISRGPRGWNIGCGCG